MTINWWQHSVGYTPTPEYTPMFEDEEWEETDYGPSLEEDMVNDDYYYGEDFIINYGIMSIQPA